MRIREFIVKAGTLGIMAAGLLVSREASAQTPTVPPLAARDTNWETVSHVTMVAGVAIVSLMPRVYYNDPEATVGWKGRWHVSMLAPAMTLVGITMLVEGPIKNAIKSPRPGCGVDAALFPFPGSNCETFGGPSTHAFASWGATGAGLGIFLVDTLKYSGARFHAGAFVGNVALPVTLSVLTSVARGLEIGFATDGVTPIQAHENVGQIVAGGLTGLLSGAILGVGYALLQKPNCGYGNNIFCW